MTQSSLLVGLLAATFLLYLAARGRLPTYTEALWGPKPSSSGGSSKSSSPDWLSWVDTAAQVATVAAG